MGSAGPVAISWDLHTYLSHNPMSQVSGLLSPRALCQASPRGPGNSEAVPLPWEEPPGNQHLQDRMVNLNGVSSGGPKEGKLGLHKCSPGSRAPGQAFLEAQSSERKPRITEQPTSSVQGRVNCELWLRVRGSGTKRDRRKNQCPACRSLHNRPLSAPPAPGPSPHPTPPRPVAWDGLPWLPKPLCHSSKHSPAPAGW